MEEKSHGTSAVQKITKEYESENASERTIWIASVDAMHTRTESAEKKGEMMVGAKEIAILITN